MRSPAATNVCARRSLVIGRVARGLFVQCAAGLRAAEPRIQSEARAGSALRFGVLASAGFSMLDRRRDAA